MKFKRGDKVWVYGVSENQQIPLKLKAKVSDIYDDELLGLEGKNLSVYEPSKEDKDRFIKDWWDLTLAHPMQCRKRNEKNNCH